MKSKSSAGEALNKITIDVGVSNTIISDGDDQRNIEPYSPWHNQAKNTIGITKAKAMKGIIRIRVPKPCWDFGIVWEG